MAAFQHVAARRVRGRGTLLSTIGLYGVMAASVRQRLAEIGVRLALGATAGDVRRLVLGEGLRLAVVGALAAWRWRGRRRACLRGMLFETEPLDPVTLTGAAALLVGAAVLATYLPARRATRVDPSKCCGRNDNPACCNRSRPQGCPRAGVGGRLRSDARRE